MKAYLDEVFARNSHRENFSAFRVVIVYESFRCGTRAMQLYERLTKEFAKEFPFQLDLWKCEILDLLAIGDAAAEAAAAADMIIISVEGTGDLCSECRLWIEKWIVRRNEGDGALVALFNPASEPLEGVASVRAYLAAVARRGKMKFLAPLLETNHEAQKSSPRPMPRRPQEMRPPVKELLCQHDDVSH